MAKFFYVIGIITLVLSGGCSLWALGEMNNSKYVRLEDVLLIGGVPFVIGLIIFFLARRSLKNRLK